MKGTRQKGFPLGKTNTELGTSDTSGELVMEFLDASAGDMGVFTL